MDKAQTLCPNCKEKFETHMTPDGIVKICPGCGKYA